uniref:Cystatin domain-containing protein n=1 Tax=Sander lucioperca TaxID=283035 RepID=A0A8D0DGB1_SANLU
IILCCSSDSKPCQYETSLCKNSLERKTVNYLEFKAVEYCSPVVAGTNYLIKVNDQNQPPHIFLETDLRTSLNSKLLKGCSLMLKSSASLF